MSLLNKLENKTVYAVFHNDLDGVMSRVVYEHFCKKQTKLSIVVNTGNDCEHVENQIIDKSDVILFVDISPTKELLKFIQDSKKEIIIVDHHIETYKKYKDQIEDYHFDNEKCGAKLLFELVKPKRVKPIINQVMELVDTYDRWQYKEELWQDAVNLHACLFEGLNWQQIIIKNIEPTEYFRHFVADMLLRFRYFDTWQFNDKDQIKIAKFKKKVQEAYKKSKKTMKKRLDNKGQTYLYFEADSKLSFVCHRLLHEKADIDYIVVYNTFEKANMKLSLRAKDDSDINVGEIASLWAGSEGVSSAGGHEKASGVMFTDKELFNEVCKGRKHLV